MVKQLILLIGPTIMIILGLLLIKNVPITFCFSMAGYFLFPFWLATEVKSVLV